MNAPATPLTKIFLTGGTGFIGSQLAQHAVKSGHEVTVASPVNNSVEKFRCDMLERSGIRILEAALEDTPRIRDSLGGHNVIIHLAAAQHEAEAPESPFIASRGLAHRRAGSGRGAK